MPVHLLFHAVTAPNRVGTLYLPLASHHQASAVHLHHQLLRAEAVSIHLHLETFSMVTALHSYLIIPEQPHRQRGHLITFSEGHAGALGSHPALVGETVTDLLHPSEQLLLKGASRPVQSSALGEVRRRARGGTSRGPTSIGPIEFCMTKLGFSSKLLKFVVWGLPCPFYLQGSACQLRLLLPQTLSLRPPHLPERAEALTELDLWNELHRSD